MKTGFAIFLFFFSITFTSAQNIFTQQRDSSDIKMKSYLSLIEKADVYEQKAELELSKATFYKSEARRLLDSASVVAKKAETDKSKSKFYVMQFNILYGMAEKYSNKTDSSLAIAKKYKDTASIKNKDAEAYYLLIAEDYKPIVNGDTIESVIYVVQIGAGNMEESYFDKVNEVHVITPKDGIRRYFVGEFTSKETAIEYRNKMVALGFEDAFIRTLDSLHK